MKSCTFYRPDKVFSKENSNAKLGDHQANLNYLQGNLTQDIVYGNCPLKTLPLKGVTKNWVF